MKTALHQRAAAGLVAVAVALAGVSCRPKGAARETLTLAENLSPISGVTIVAAREGFFASRGLEVSVSEFTTGKQCLETVVGGGADVATTAESPTTAAAMAGQDIALLARTEYSYLKTLTAAKAQIRTLADLRGKRVAFTAGTGGELYTLRLLEKAGLTRGDVTLVNLRPEDMPAALANGSVDAYDTWEPHILNGMRALGAEARLLDTRGIYSETFNVVTRKDLVGARRPALRAFMAALVDAEDFIHAHREQAIDVVASAVGMDRNDLASFWDDYDYDVVLDQRTLDVLRAHASWRLASGNHPPGAAMPDWHDVIASAVLRDVDPARIRVEGY